MFPRSSPDSRFLKKHPHYTLRTHSQDFPSAPAPRPGCSYWQETSCPSVGLAIQSFVPREGRKQLLTSLAQFPGQSESLVCCHLSLLSTRSWEPTLGRPVVTEAGPLLPGSWGGGTPCHKPDPSPAPSSPRSHSVGVGSAEERLSPENILRSSASEAHSPSHTCFLVFPFLGYDFWRA